MSFINSGEKILVWASRMMNYGGSILLAFMMLMTVVDVAGRYIFSKPIKGSVEVIEFCMVVVGSLSVAYCTVKGMQIRVDILEQVFPRMLRIVLDIITHILTIGAYGIVMWMCFLESIDMWLVYKDMSTVLFIPFYPFYFVFTAGISMLCLAMIFQLIHVIKEVVKK